MLHKKSIIEKAILILSLISLILFTAACDEDPIAPQEEHTEAIGMVFYASNVEIARIEKGVTSDTFVVPIGALTEHIDIKLIDEDNEEFVPHENESESLAWEIENNSIVDVLQESGAEGSFTFQLYGRENGETSIEFFVMHGDHNDFRSGEIPVKVEAQVTKITF